MEIAISMFTETVHAVRIIILLLYNTLSRIKLIIMLSSVYDVFDIIVIIIIPYMCANNLLSLDQMMVHFQVCLLQ